MKLTKRQSSSIVFLLGALTTVSPFSIDMYLPAFQQIAASLNTTIPRVSLSISSYFVGLALGQIFYGPLLDRFGRKPPLYAGLTIYIVTSIACMLSPNIEALIFFRFLQATGACAAQVGAIAMVRDFFPPEQSARVFSKQMLTVSVSPLFAPTVGGFLASALGWQSVFFSLVVIGALMLLAVFFFLPEGHQADPTISLSPVAIAKEFGVIFKTRQFFAFAVSGAFSFAALFVYVAGAPSIFLGTFQLSERMFGAIFAALSIGLVCGGQINLFLGRFFSDVAIFKGALRVQFLTAIVFIVGSQRNAFDLYGHVAIFAISLSCIGLTYPNAASLALLPFEKNRGAAAALLGCLQMGIGALASSAVGLFPFPTSLSVGIVFAITASIGLFFFSFRPRKEIGHA